VELNWSTFALELINFLVLIWILKRFLYKPVLAAIERRRARVDKILQDAQALERAATARKQEYQQRLAHWEQQQASAHHQLEQELETERQRLHAELLAGIEKEREREQALLERAHMDHQRDQERQALAQGARFTARLLGRLASPALQQRLLDMALEDLAAIPDARRVAICTGLNGESRPIEVSSAFALSAPQRQQLQQAIGHWLQCPLPAWRFTEDERLLAGIRIQLGAWILRANLEDELGFFCECTDV
jgi:F-type H+-transporting ATPase subunit b